MFPGEGDESSVRGNPRSRCVTGVKVSGDRAGLAGKVDGVWQRAGWRCGFGLVGGGDITDGAHVANKEHHR